MAKVLCKDLARSILPILCTLALVPILLWLGGANEIGSGLVRALPSVGLAWLWWLAARGYGHWLLPGSSEMGPVVGVVGMVFLDQCLGRLGLMDLTSAWGLLALGLLGYRRTTPTQAGSPDGMDDAPLGRAWNGGPCAPRRLGTRSSAATTSVLPPRASGRLVDAGTHGALDHQRLLRTARRFDAFLHLHALSGRTRVTGLAAQVLCDFGDPHASLLHHKNAAAALVFLMTPWVVTGSMAYTEVRRQARMRDDLHLRGSDGSGQACCLGLLAGGIALAKPSRCCCWPCRLRCCFAAPNRRQPKPALLSIGIALIVSMPWWLDNTYRWLTFSRC